MAGKSLEERFRILEAKLGDKTLQEHFREQAELIDRRLDEGFHRQAEMMDARFAEVNGELSDLRTNFRSLRTDVGVIREGVKIILEKLDST